MMRLVWKQGRFRWPFIGAIAYLTLALVIADYAWRSVELPFEAFALDVMTAIALGAVILSILAHRLQARQQRPESQRSAPP